MGLPGRTPRLAGIMGAATMVLAAALTALPAPAVTAQERPPQPATPATPATPEAPAPRPDPPRPATMKELMLDLIYPTSDVLFYVAREEPKNDAEWLRIQLYALTLAETANVLMAPPRARDQGQWMKDAKLLLDVGLTAYRAAQKRDYKTLVDLNGDLYEACQACHVNYRPGYRRRP
jgi:cytochrome c556